MEKVSQTNPMVILQSTLRKKNLLSIYFTAGYPNLEDTEEIVLTLQEAGADLVEIGFPFSDPVADGPVIQQSSFQSLQNGMNLEILFRQLERVKNKLRIPVILMGYLNPVMQFGIEDFCQACRNCNVAGVIIPDLPVNNYHSEYFDLFSSNGLSVIFLITPETSIERIHLIDSLSSSFIYAVSSNSTTGAKTKFAQKNLDYLSRISNMHLNHPVLAGFGISNRQMFEQVCSLVSGGIIGSSFIEILAGKENRRDSIFRFIKSIKQDDN